jgi:uncharacterized protein (TIGR00299 family) protein
MPGTVAWLDVSVGVSGDMLLGALVDAGADLAGLQDAVDRVLPQVAQLTATPVQRAGLRALKVDVASAREEHPHRPWRGIRDRIASARLTPSVADRATAVFRRLAEVEARAHGVPVDDVEFHEVGAWDSVADVVGTCAALDLLGVDEVVTTTLALGSGSVRSAHGTLPVPVPAVLGLVDGWSVTSGGDGELATPTGVALVTTLASAQGPLPSVDVTAFGVGAGTRDPSDRPNVVRVVLGRPSRQERGGDAHDGNDEQDEELVSASMRLLEANVDDLDPRLWPTVVDELLRVGAADAWLTPILMKKGRPAHTLSVLTSPENALPLRDRILELTSTFGVRQTAVDRWALDRGWTDVAVEGRAVAVKVGHRNGVIVDATPEFVDVAHLAAELERPVRDVLAAVSAAAVLAGLTPGARIPSRLRSTSSGEPAGR